MLENNKNKIVSMLDGRKREGEHLVSLPPRQKKKQKYSSRGLLHSIFSRLWLSKDFDTLSLSPFRLFVCLFFFACFASFVEKKSKVE